MDGISSLGQTNEPIWCFDVTDIQFNLYASLGFDSGGRLSWRAFCWPALDLALFLVPSMVLLVVRPWLLLGYLLLTNRHADSELEDNSSTRRYGRTYAALFDDSNFGALLNHILLYWVHLFDHLCSNFLVQSRFLFNSRRLVWTDDWLAALRWQN